MPMRDVAQTTWNDLTPREREIALLVAAGVSQKQIASRLDIHTGTVGAHIDRIAKKILGNGRPAVRITRFVLTASSTHMAA